MIPSEKKLSLDPKHKIYFLSNDFPGLTQRTTKDIKPGETPGPNRRTYGSALSGKFLDRSIFFGSIALFFHSEPDLPTVYRFVAVWSLLQGFNSPSELPIFLTLEL